jgi:hypothetical protein
MDSKPPLILLPNNIVKRCTDYAADLVGAYAAPANSSMAASRAVSSHGIEKDSSAQALAKMAECAFCQWAKVPIEKLNWQIGRPDKGSDIFWLGVGVDIKHTRHLDGALIWPVNKRHIFHSKRFHIIVLVRGKNPFELAGSTLKSLFFAQKREIGPGEKLTEGTWQFTGELWPLAILEEQRRIAWG